MKPTTLLTVLLCAGLFCSMNSYANTYYWTGSSSSNWNVYGNWALSNCGGSTPSSLPGTGDSVVFSGGCSNNNCTINVSISVLSFRIDNAYTGTITQSSGNAITVSYGKFADGTFTGSSAAITFSTALTIEGGTFTTSSGTTTIKGNFSYTGGTFNHNNGRVVFYNSLTFSGTSSITLYDAEFQAVAGNTTITLSNNITVNDSALLTGSHQLFINSSNSSAITADGEIKIYNTSTTGGGTATIIVNGSSTQHVTGNATTEDVGKLPNLTINSSGTVYLIGYITMGGSTTLTYTAGTINVGTSTVVFYYDNTITGSMTFNNVEFQGTGSTCIISNTVTVNCNIYTTLTGSVVLNTGTIDLYGNLVVSNTSGNSGGSATISLSGATNDSIIASLGVTINEGYIPAVTINKTGGTLYLSGIISEGGNWTNNYSQTNINPGTSTFYFNPGNGSIGGTYSTPVWNAEFGAGNDWTYTMSIDSALIVKHNLTLVRSDYFYLNGHSINVYGSIIASNTGGGDQGTTVFNLVGSASDSIISPPGYTFGECYLPAISINKTGGTLYLSGLITEGGNWTNNYSKTNINPGTSTFYFNPGNGSIGGTYNTPVWNAEFGVAGHWTYTMNSDSALIVKNNLIISGSGYFNLNGYCIPIYGNIIAGNTGGGDQGTTVFNLVGSANDSIISPSGYTFGECYLPAISINKTGGTLYLSGLITEGGNWTNNYSKTNINPGTSTFYFNTSNGSIGGTYNTPVWNAEFGVVGHWTYTMNSDSALIVKNNLIISGSGYFNLNGYCIPIYGNIIAGNTGGGDQGTTVFNLVGSANDSITSPSGYTLGECYLPSVYINKTSNTLHLIGNITDGGNWTYINGTINSGTSTVGMYGSSYTLTGATGSDTMSFNNLVIANGTTLASTLKVAGNLTINSGKTFSASSSNYQISLAGNWINNGTYTGNNSNVTFNGSLTDSIKGSSATSFYSLTLDKTGTLTLAEPATVTNSLNLTSGDILTTSTNLLTLNNGSLITGGSDNSFVSGPIKKIGNSAFTFPTGAGSSYHPIGITAPSSTSDAFTAQYFNSSPSSPTTTDDSLTYVSACDYWNLARTTGSSNVKVTLGWGTGSCDIKRLSSLRVGYWNGSEWINLGQSANTGSTTSGTVTAATTSTSFGNNFAISKHSPTPTVSAGSATAVCYGTSTTIGGSPTATSGFSPYTYSWSPATALSSSTASNPTASPTTTTTYTVTVNDDDNAPIATATVVVTVNPQLTANAGNDTTIYRNSVTVTLGGSPTASGGTSPYTYGWTSIPTGFTSSSANPVATQTATTTYYLTVTDNTGCSVSSAALVTTSLPQCVSSSECDQIGDSYFNGYVSGEPYYWADAWGSPDYILWAESPYALPYNQNSYYDCNPDISGDGNGLAGLNANSGYLGLWGGWDILNNCDSSNSHYSNGTDCEASFACVNLKAGQEYILSFWYLDPITVNAILGGTENLWADSLKWVAFHQEDADINFPGGQSYVPAYPHIDQSQVIVGLVGDGSGDPTLSWTNCWQHYVACFTASDNYDGLLVYPICNYTILDNSCYTAYLYITNIQLVPYPNNQVLYDDCDNTTSITAACPLDNTTFTWSPSSGLSSVTAITVTTNPTETTSYTCDMTLQYPPTSYDPDNCFPITADYTVNVSSLNLITSATEICDGACATLTATGGSGDYTWSPSTGLSATAGSSVRACPSVSTTYTMTDPNDPDCQLGAGIIVNPTPTITISPNPAIICYGNSVTLTASGGTSYTWSPSVGLSATTGSSVTANPTVTTTYYASSTNSYGCTGVGERVVWVNPLPIISVTQSTYSSCAVPNTFTLTSAYSTASWTCTNGSPSSGSGGSFTVTSWSGSGPYSVTVTVTNSTTGCENTLIIPIQTCCSGDVVLTNGDVGDLIGSLTACCTGTFTYTAPTLTTSDIIVFDNAFNVDVNDFTFENCPNLIFTENTQLNIESGKEFNIINSVLTTCGNMWEGIYIPDAKTTLNVSGGSSILNAIRAVESNNGGIYNIQSTTFDRDLIGIQVDPLSSENASTVVTSNFTCTSPLQPPYSGLTSRSGIFINQVNGISIGDLTTGDENIFNALNNGIHINDFSTNLVTEDITFNNIYINYNSFQNINNIDGNNIVDGNGIYIYGPAQEECPIIQSGMNYNNDMYDFTNCNTGIFMTGLGYNQVQIENNDMHPVTNGVVAQAFYGLSTINNNTIDQCLTGISVNNCPSGRFIIGYNTITNAPYTAAFYPVAPIDFGIDIEDGVTPSRPNIYCNTIYPNKVAVGINLNSTGKNAQVATNTINLPASAHFSGIALTNANGSTIINNTVEGTESSGMLSGTAINCNYSINCPLINNTTGNTVYGFQFQGGCTGTEMWNNTMNYHKYGFLANNNGILGVDGIVGTTNYASGNLWEGDGSVGLVFDNTPNNFGAFSYNTAEPTIFNYSPFATPNTPAYPFPNLYVEFRNLSNVFKIFSLPACSISNFDRLLVDVDTVTGIDSVTAVNTVSNVLFETDAYTFQSGEIESVKRALYNYILRDSSIFSYSTTLRTFYDTAKVGSMGQYTTISDSIQSLMDSVSLTLSDSVRDIIINSILSTNTSALSIQLYQSVEQQLNSIYLKTIASGIDTFNSGQQDTLQYIAGLCPDVAGTSVYNARSLVKLFDDSIYFNDSTICSSGGDDLDVMKKYFNQNQPTISYLKVYPNPAKDEVNIVYQITENNGVFELYDVTGRLINSLEINSQLGQLIMSLSGFSPGIYIYKLTSQGDSDKIGKLAVIK